MSRFARSDVIDLTLILVRETERAILVRETETSQPVWLPRAEIEVAPNGLLIEVTLPAWLAQDRGLI